MAKKKYINRLIEKKIGTYLNVKNIYIDGNFNIFFKYKKRLIKKTSTALKP